MKYYLVIVQNDESQAVYAYDNVDAALAALHSELAYRGDGRNSTLCIIFNAYGAVIKNERWERVIEPEPEQESE